jgi:hypothetical protein
VAETAQIPERRLNQGTDFMRSSLALVILGLLAFSPLAQSKDKSKKSPPKPPQDAIEVVGHIASARGTVTRFLSTQHYSSYYLYVEHEGGGNVTLIDVSNITQPAILAEIASNPTSASENLFVVNGTAALAAEQTASARVAAPQTIRIMDFSDPKQPRVAREFTGVTALTRDERRGLIFLANPEGIWILHQSFAVDPEVQRQYMDHVLYDH